MAKISVIVPFYNEEERIARCIDSLINQTFKDFELILINDGSTDNSAKIVEKYAEKYKNITLINQKNAGQGAARNNGINNSKSPYITFIDADDYVDCEYLNILYKDLKKNNVDISICDIVKVKKDQEEYYDNYNNLLGSKIKNYMISHPGPVARLYKKELFTNNNIYFPEGIIYEDLGTIPLLGLYAHTIPHINAPLYSYVIRENSTMKMQNFNKKIDDIFIVIEHLDKEFAKRTNGEYNDVLEYLYIEHLLYSATLRYIQFKDVRKKYINKIRNIIDNKFPNWKNNQILKRKSLKFKIVVYLAYYKKICLLSIIKNLKK